MHITGTHFNYYQICHRKLWLFANSIQMEHSSDLVYEGKLIHESTYPRRSEKYEEVEIAGIKVDYYDPKEKMVHEIKKSDKHEQAHEWQAKYYLFVLQNHGVEAKSAFLEYPRLRKTLEVFLSEADRKIIHKQLNDITSIIANDICPDRIAKSKCKNCSYFDFCWSGEAE